MFDSLLLAGLVLEHQSFFTGQQELQASWEGWGEPSPVEVVGLDVGGDLGPPLGPIVEQIFLV